MHKLWLAVELAGILTETRALMVALEDCSHLVDRVGDLWYASQNKRQRVAHS